MAGRSHDHGTPFSERPRDAAPGERPGPAPQAGTAAHDAGAISAYAQRPTPLPSPLVLGEVRDPTEAEADAVADRGHCTSQVDGHATTPPGRESLTAAHDALRGPGRELDPQTRLHFHRTLGHDFGEVRVYASSEASRAARGLGARAFSVGGRIGFADGQLSTTAGEGRHLLAHELAHVLQQRSTSTPRTLWRKPWGPRAKGTRASASQMFRWAAAEAYAVLQYQARNSGHVLITNEMLATGVRPNATGADKAVVDAIYSEFHHGHEVKRRTVAPPQGVTDRAESDPVGALQAATEATKALQQPDILDVTTSEVYDVTTVGERDAKVLKINNRYVRLLNTITSRSWRAGSTLQPFVPLTTSLGKLGTITFAPTDLDRWPGVIQYEVIEADGKKKQKKQKKNKEKAKKVPAKTPAKKSPTKKTPAKKPPAQNPAAKKPSAATPGGNLGFGIGIMSSGGGKGNAVLGVSINSSGTSVGTVSAGVVYNSSGDAVGAVAVGAGANNSGATAASAGAGAASGSSGTSVATAGAGTSKNSSGTSVASAGAGSAQDVSMVAIGEAGTGDVTNAEGRDKEAMPSGSGKSGRPASGGPATTDRDAKRDARAASKDGAGGEPGQIGAGEAGGGGRAGGLSVPAATDTQVTAAVGEAARIDAELRGMSEAQRHLLVAIIQRSETGQHEVASAASVAAFKAATSGLSEADLAFLETRQWVPGEVSAEVLRRQIAEHLKHRGQPQGEPPGPSQADALKRDQKSAEKTVKKAPPSTSATKKPSAETQEALFRRLLERAKKTDWSTIPDPGMVTWSKDVYGEVSGAVYFNTVIDGARVRVTGDIAGIRSKTPTGDALVVTATSAILVSPDGVTADGTALIGQRLTFQAR